MLILHIFASQYIMSQCVLTPVQLFLYTCLHLLIKRTVWAELKWDLAPALSPCQWKNSTQVHVDSSGSEGTSVHSFIVCGTEGYSRVHDPYTRKVTSSTQIHTHLSAVECQNIPKSGPGKLKLYFRYITLTCTRGARMFNKWRRISNLLFKCSDEISLLPIHVDLSLL